MQVSLADRALPSHDGAAAAPGPGPSPSPDPRAEPGPSFAQVLLGLGRAVDGGAAMLGSAAASLGGGGDLGPERLLALQLGVYRYSEAIDLTSHLVDRVTGAIKAIVQAGGP